MAKKSQFAWKEYLKENRKDININSFQNWCVNNRTKKTIFNTEQELIETIIKYDNRENKKKSNFNWQQYLQENRQDINISSFRYWCNKYRNKKCMIDTKQELIDTLQLYDNRTELLKFDWQQYLQDNRPDISIYNFTIWCIRHRAKKSVFYKKQELLQTISLYEKSIIRKSQFNWQQYIKENRLDININSFKNWCTRNRLKKQIFDTEQELLETLQLYDDKKSQSRPQSQFKWRQYLQENRPDMNIDKFTGWCQTNRSKKQIFDTEQELIEATLRYDLCDKYILRKTQYDGIYNLTERETGLKFNFYKLGDMLGLIQ